jgi:hypothetical protein
MAVEVTLDTLDCRISTGPRRNPARSCAAASSRALCSRRTANGNDPESLFKIQTAIGIPFGTAISPNFNTYTLQRIFVQGIVPGGAKFQLIYQNLLFSGIPPSTYILRDGATLQSVGNVNLLPRLKTLLRVAKITLADGTEVPSRKASFTYTQNLRVVGVSALLFGQPTDNQDIVGKVNAGIWHGKPQGYWKRNPVGDGGQQIRELLHVERGRGDEIQRGLVRHRSPLQPCARRRCFSGRGRRECAAASRRTQFGIILERARHP